MNDQQTIEVYNNEGFEPGELALIDDEKVIVLKKSNGTTITVKKYSKISYMIVKMRLWLIRKLEF